MKKYNFSNQPDDFRRFLRQYKLDDSLKRVYKESLILLQNYGKNGYKAVKRAGFYLCKKGAYKPQWQDTTITAWTLLDIAYYLICESNDYIGTPIENDEELYALNFAVFDFINQDKQYEDILLYCWGMLGEQIKFQRIESIFEGLYRDIFILFIINHSQDFNFTKILFAETGIPSWQTIVAYLIRTWIEFVKSDTLEEVLNTIEWQEENDREKYERLIARFTANYEDIRNSKYKRQELYRKPFIETQKGEIIPINIFLNLFMTEHCIYWIIRDYYQKRKSQDFTNCFGILFEDYFEELMSNCLRQGEYQRITESEAKRADWKIYIGNHRFLVEQKSSLLLLDVKQQSTNVSNLKKYVEDHILEAITQLHDTEKDLNDGQYIKVVLMYEDYLRPNIINHCFDLDECQIENDHHYWLATIRELELLFSLAPKNPTLFQEVVTEKIERELYHKNQLTGLDDILREKGITENEYIKQMDFVKEMEKVLI